MSISLSHVMKSFGSDRVVDGVSLEIADGEFFVVLGPSGCGKTTLLRLIAGLEAVDGGEIVLADKRVAGESLHVPPEDRNVGFVFQSYALWPHMTVAENIAFPLQAGSAAKGDIQKTVQKCLRTVELVALADRKPAQLSGGQRQRVALARCLAQQAGIILMDEPLANLDPHLRTAMEEELARFHDATGATTLYITHDQREAMALADRLAVMWEGQILQVAAPDEIYRRPCNERVARFIGRSAIIDGEVLKVADGDCRIRIGRAELDAKCAAGTGPGSVRIMIRPEDLSHGQHDNAVPTTIQAVAYRGGYWEAVVNVEGVDVPLVVNMPSKPGVGDQIPIVVNAAWVLPQS